MGRSRDRSGHRRIESNGIYQKQWKNGGGTRKISKLKAKNRARPKTQKIRKGTGSKDGGLDCIWV